VAAPGSGFGLAFIAQFLPGNRADVRASDCDDAQRLPVGVFEAQPLCERISLSPRSQAGGLDHDRLGLGLGEFARAHVPGRVHHGVGLI